MFYVLKIIKHNSCPYLHNISIICTDKYGQIIQDLVTAVNTFGDVKYRCNYFQFLTKHYGWKYLRDKYGCLAGKVCQNSARKHIQNNNGVAHWAPKFGRKGLPEDKELNVKRFLINNSR